MSRGRDARPRLASLLATGAALLLHGGLAGLAAVEGDPVTAAASAAWREGRPLMALDLLRGHPGLKSAGAERLLAARCQLALGRHREALAALGLASAEAAAGWPPALRGAACQVAGEALVASGGGAGAEALLAAAVDAGGQGVERDRCLLLLAEEASRRGDAAACRRHAEALWRGRARDAYRARAGLLLATLDAETAPLRARELLAAVRALDGLGDGERTTAAELLCHILLADHPGQCLVVAERELAQARAGGTGRLPLYRALALAALDAQEGLRALAVLPAGQRDHPAAIEAGNRLRLALASGTGVDQRRRLERAAAAAELERWDEVRGLVEASARHDPAALALLARCPGVDLEGHVDSAAARDPSAALALIRGLTLAGRHAVAWRLAEPLVRAPSAPAALLHWAAESARVASPGHLSPLRARLLALPGEGVETGLAWVAEAQRLEAAGEAGGAAWKRAAVALPGDHPWKPAAAWRAVRAMLLAEGDPAECERLLLAARPQADHHEDRLRCRFLLIQVWERQGRVGEALELAQTMHAHAGPEQAPRVDALVARLRALLPEAAP